MSKNICAYVSAAVKVNFSSAISEEDINHTL